MSGQDLKIMPFDEALEESRGTRRILLLGNGFSIDCSDVFEFSTLHGRAAPRISLMIPNVSKVFAKADTVEFEKVTRMLQNTQDVLECYYEGHYRGRIGKHQDILRELFLETIIEIHPDDSIINQQKLYSCATFLSYFLVGDDQAPGQVYTLNYDLLLGWVLEESAAAGILKFKDGFERDTPVALGYFWQQAAKQNVFYMHGAIHLIPKASRLQKLTSSGKRGSILDQVRKSRTLPLCVYDGKEEGKRDEINDKPYLKACYRKLETNLQEENVSLFVFGWSMKENDEHIRKLITGGKYRKIFLSVRCKRSASGNACHKPCTAREGAYGTSSLERLEGELTNARKEKNKRLKRVSKPHPLAFQSQNTQLDSQNELQVSFFCARSAQVWS